MYVYILQKLDLMIGRHQQNDRVTDTFRMRQID